MLHVGIAKKKKPYIGVKIMILRGFGFVVKTAKKVLQVQTKQKFLIGGINYIIKVGNNKKETF